MQMFFKCTWKVPVSSPGETARELTPDEHERLRALVPSKSKRVPAAKVKGIWWPQLYFVNLLSKQEDAIESDYCQLQFIDDSEWWSCQSVFRYFTTAGVDRGDHPSRLLRTDCRRSAQLHGILHVSGTGPNDGCLAYVVPQTHRLSFGYRITLAPA